MANFTLTASLGVVGGNVPFYSDSKCTLKLGTLTVPEKHQTPVSFTATPTTVYFRAADGAVVTLTSAGAVTANRNDGTVVQVVSIPVGV